MKKPKLKFTITKEDTGYSAHVKIQKAFIGTQADTFEELKQNMIEVANLAFEDKGFVYSIDELKFEYDLQSFFSFYRVINAKALSERIGMNQSLLAQYIKGIKKPSAAQTRRILRGVQQIGRELSEVQLLPQ